MPRRLAIAALGLMLAVALPGRALAESVLEKVARTGVLTAGTSTDAVPLAYIDDKGNFVGYSVDILEIVRSQLEKELGKPIKLELVGVTVADRIPKLVSEELDIVCEASSFTWEREKYVDFSVDYGITGTRLLVKKGSPLSTPQSLVGKRIGVIPQSVNAQVMKLVQPQATFVPVKDRAEGATALEQGKLDALASDGILLEGFRLTASNPDAFAVVPAKPYAIQGLACMLPENDSSFRDLVNYSLVSFMQGVETGDKQSTAIIDRWFGPEGIVTLNREMIDNFFRFVVDSYEQIPLTQK
ncbi:ABC transporter substrate-binding protein [Neosynechococcus sphagnicola sy1]|uniref:ABC transporter substrate-binding protein n=1 Tax=Neosynechococcus sphagnicola sy1 TaxID=1497020 RepID=A0A098TLT3_9CYAN|nr:extracellular substrate binding-like orphan protein GrrP [Neosynechococcus sphagnicola]KGF71803.1 ABC transporter substrate-binding protein [Neosynechococcus sphagnicola sy1]